MAIKTLYISAGIVKAIASQGVTITLDPPADTTVEVPASEYWSIGDAYPRDAVATTNGTGAGGGEQRPPTA